MLNESSVHIQTVPALLRTLLSIFWLTRNKFLKRNISVISCKWSETSDPGCEKCGKFVRRPDRIPIKIRHRSVLLSLGTECKMHPLLYAKVCSCTQSTTSVYFRSVKYVILRTKIFARLFMDYVFRQIIIYSQNLA